MRGKANNLESALRELEAVLDTGVEYGMILLPDTQIGRLAVAHAVMQYRPQNFFEPPNTTRLKEHYSYGLDFLVGDSTCRAHDLVQLSRQLGWHKKAEPMEGRAQKKTVFDHAARGPWPTAKPPEHPGRNHTAIQGGPRPAAGH